MTEQEIESLQQILNQKEYEIIDLDNQIGQVPIPSSTLEQLKIRFLIRLSLVPKFDPSKIKFVFVDRIMQNSVNIRALPAIELILALPESYPSHQRPLFLQRSRFYEEYGDYDKFLTAKLNEKWSEDMPVLYDMAIFIQDEMMEQYVEQEGVGEGKVVEIELQEAALA